MHPERVYMVRHGETDWNRDKRAQGHADIPLNEAGLRQARAIAERLRSVAIEAVYSSDLRRAAQTAAVIGEAVGVEPLLTPAFREMNIGALEGTRDVGSLVTRAAASVEPIADGAETIGDMRVRVLAGWQRLCQHEGAVVLVGHGGTLKGLIAHLIGLPPEHLDRISLRGNCGLSIIEFPNGAPRLALLNDTSHLA